MLAGCGENQLRAEPDCPTDAEVSELTSEQLNQIPRECDDMGPRPTDQPGVTVSSDGDDRGGHPTSVALESSGPPGEVIAGEIDRLDDVDFWGLDWPGGVIHVVATAKGDSVRVAVTDLDGRVQLGSIGATAVSDLKGALPGGQYLVRIFSAESEQIPLSYRVVSQQGK